MNPFFQGFLKRAQQLRMAAVSKVPESIKPAISSTTNAQPVPTPVGEVADKGTSIPSQPL